MSIEILSKNSKYSGKAAKVWCDLASSKVSKSADTQEEATLPRSRPRSAASNSHCSARGARKGPSDSDDDDSTAGATNSSMTSKEGVSAMKVSLLSQQAAHLKTLLSCLEKVVAPVGMQRGHHEAAGVHRPVSYYATWGIVEGDDVLAKSTDGRSSSAKTKIIIAPNVSLDEVFEVVNDYVDSYLLFGHDTTNGSSIPPDSSRNNASASSRPMSAAELPSNELLTQHQHAFLRVLKVLTQVLSYCHSRIQPLIDLRKAAGYQLDNVIREFTHTASTLSEAGKTTGTSSLARRNSVVSKAHQSRYEEALQAVRIAVLGVLHSYFRLREASPSDLQPYHRLYDLEVSMGLSLDTTRGYLQERLAKLQRTMRASLPQQLQAALLSLPLAGGSYFGGSCDVEVPTAFALPILPRDIPDICATPFLLHSRVLEFLSNIEDTTTLPTQHQNLISGIRIYLSTLDVGGSGKSRHDVAPNEIIDDEHSYPSTLMQVDTNVQDAPPGTQGLRLLKPLHSVSKVREPSQTVQRPLSSQGRGKLLVPISHPQGDTGSCEDSAEDVDMRGTYPPYRHVAAPYLVHGGKARKGSRGGVMVQRLVDYRASRARCPEALSKAHHLEVSALRIQLWWALASRIRTMKAEEAIFVARRHSSVVSAPDANGVIQAPVEIEVLEEEALKEYEDNVEWCRARQYDLLRENYEREQRAIQMQNDSAAVIQRFLGSICQCREPRKQLRDRNAHRRQKHAVSTIESWWCVALPLRRRHRESRQCRSGNQREFHSRQRLAVAQHKDTWERILLSVVLLQRCGRGYRLRNSRPTTNGPTLKELRHYFFVVRRDALASKYGRRWQALTRSRRQRRAVRIQRSVPMITDATVTAAIRIGKVVRGFLSRCRYAHLQIRERILEGNFRRAVASYRVDPTVKIPPFPLKMRIAAGRIVRFILRSWSQRAVHNQRKASVRTKEAVAVASRKASAVLSLQNTLYRGILMAKKERHIRRMQRDEAALRKELDELESQNTVGSLYRHHLSAKVSDLTEDKIACRAGNINVLSLPRPQSGHIRPGSASLLDSMSVRARYEHMKVEGDIREDPHDEMDVEPIATTEVMRRHLKRIQRIDASTVPPISFPLPKLENKTEPPFMQSLTEHLMERCSPALLYVLRVALCADLHSNAHDHNNLRNRLSSNSKGDLPARHSIRLLEALRELGQDQLDRQWLSVFDDDDDMEELNYSCTGTDMPQAANPSLATQWASRGKPSGIHAESTLDEAPQTLKCTPSLECRWSNAAALAVEISEHAAVVGWRAIYSRTTYDLYKQNVVAEDKGEKRERFQRVYIDRNLCIQSCYRVGSEEKWLIEVSKDIRKAGEVYKPARSEIDTGETDVEERRLSAFYFTFDFITQCFPRVFEDTSRDANECLSENLPAYLIVLAIQHLVAAKLNAEDGEEFGYALSAQLPEVKLSHPDTDSDVSSDTIEGIVDLGVRLVVFLFGDTHDEGGDDNARGLASMFKGKPFVYTSLLREHPLD